MKHHIKVIAFDADDTLWSNEPFFQEVEQKYTELLNDYGSAQEISEELFKTEMGNLECLGYGVKAFTIQWLKRRCELVNKGLRQRKYQEIILFG